MSKARTGYATYRYIDGKRTPGFEFPSRRGARKFVVRAPEPPLDVVVPRTWGISSAQEVIDLLIQARKAKNIPAAHVAEMMGVNPVILYRLERNERDPKLSTALRYARALGLDVQLVETKPTRSRA